MRTIDYYYMRTIDYYYIRKDLRSYLSLSTLHQFSLSFFVFLTPFGRKNSVKTA